MTEMTYNDAVNNKKYLLENIEREQRRILELAKEMGKSINIIEDYKNLAEQCEYAIFKHAIEQKLKDDTYDE